MAVVDTAPLDKSQQATCEPTRTLEYQCKCGCTLFRVDVGVYADGSWSPILICAGCSRECVVTEPKLNGPH